MLRLFDLPYGNRPDYEGGVLVRECAELLESFFAQRRKKNKRTILSVFAKWIDFLLQKEYFRK